PDARPVMQPEPLFFLQAEDGIRHFHVTGVQTCALPIYSPLRSINTIISRYLIDRRGECIVDHGQNTMFLTQLANIFQVRNIEVWVGRCFYKNEFCIGFYSSFESLVVGLVYLRHLYTVLQEKVAHKC